MSQQTKPEQSRELSRLGAIAWLKQVDRELVTILESRESATVTIELISTNGILRGELEVSSEISAEPKTGNASDLLQSLVASIPELVTIGTHRSVVVVVRCADGLMSAVLADRYKKQWHQ